ncbi:MAG TPA: sugar phosphate isomerase/epimerase [Gemmatimonadales bacterium]|jgi:sugar phosphate isomerase/epimerase|nr:sugar phosphate isomerase/epimerase [Gemmatimonadales bacterium]
MNCDRREFIAAAGAGALALTLPAVGAACEPPLQRADRLGNIGVQLYTVRALLAKDFDGTMEQVARIGYKEVEFAGYYDRTPADLRRQLDGLGLRAPSAHIGLEDLGDNWAHTLDAAQTLGHDYLVVAWLDKKDRATLGALRSTIEKFNRAGEEATKRGIGFAYHNHDFEFSPVEGRLPYDVLLAECDPENVKFEMDLYWITKGGQDPVSYFEKYPGRFPMVHVKDMAAGQRMVSVGKGQINWARIFSKHDDAGIQHYFVEHDEPEDPMASIAESYRYLRALRF